MTDNSFYEPTQPLQPPDQGQQEKLVLGNFQNPEKDANKRRGNKPYQNPYAERVNERTILSQPWSGGPGEADQPTIYPPRYPAPPKQPAQPIMPTMAVTPNAEQYPYHQPEQVGGGNIPGPQTRSRPTRPRRRRGCLIGCLVVLLLLCVVGGFGLVTAQRVLAFGSAISTQSPLSTQTSYMGTSDRVNLLVMGYGGGNHQGANLTDSMAVMSLLPQNHHTTLISVPRDLWVQVPSGSGHYAKINTVYQVGSDNGKDPAAGGEAAAKKVSQITGLDVKYWLTINFNGFRELIDALGGIDIYVPDAFTANYPKNDHPSINASWIKVKFTKGTQHMNGERAIEYARARYVLDNSAEGTDFARSARQQIIMKAVFAKVKQMSTWPSLFNAMDALQHTIYTNLSLADLTQFSLKLDLNNAHRVGLSNQNVLVDAYSDDGQAILTARNKNWQGIIDYVRRQLYN